MQREMLNDSSQAFLMVICKENTAETTVTVVKLVCGCCQLQLLVHVPVCQAHRAVQVQQSSFGFQLERHAGCLSGFQKLCRLTDSPAERPRVEQLQLIGLN